MTKWQLFLAGHHTKSSLPINEKSYYIYIFFMDIINIQLCFPTIVYQCRSLNSKYELTFNDDIIWWFALKICTLFLFLTGWSGAASTTGQVLLNSYFTLLRFTFLNILLHRQPLIQLEFPLTISIMWPIPVKYIHNMCRPKSFVN